MGSSRACALKLGGMTGAPTYLQPVQDLRIGGRLSAGLYQYTLQGQDVTELNRWGSRVLAMARTLPELEGREQRPAGQGPPGRRGHRPGHRLETGHHLAAHRQHAVRRVRAETGSLVYTLLNQYHLVMEAAPEFWQRPETLDEIYVHSATRGMVPLQCFYPL